MKKQITGAFRFLFCFVSAAFLLTSQAYAYVDPATTSYVIQIIAGIVIACGTGIGIFYNRMKRKLKNRKQDTTSPETAGPDTEAHGGVLTAADLLEDESEKTEP